MVAISLLYEVPVEDVRLGWQDCCINADVPVRAPVMALRGHCIKPVIRWQIVWCSAKVPSSALGCLGFKGLRPAAHRGRYDRCREMRGSRLGSGRGRPPRRGNSPFGGQKCGSRGAERVFFPGRHDHLISEICTGSREYEICRYVMYRCRLSRVRLRRPSERLRPGEEEEVEGEKLSS